MAKSDTAERKDPAKRGSSKAAEPKAQGLFSFFGNTLAELKKVAWPDRQQLISESSAVLLIVIAFASFIFLIDQLFGWISGLVFG